MNLGGTAVADDALDQFAVGVDHLVKILEDGGLASLDDTGFVSFMQDLERIRNRIPLADHRIIADAEHRNLPHVLTQGSMVRTLMSALRLSPGEASRRVRAAAAVGERTSMLGQPLPPVRAQLASAQRTGEVSPEQVAIIERALSKVDHRGFDPADLVEGEELLTRFAEAFGPKQLRVLAEKVVNGIDPVTGKVAVHSFKGGEIDLTTPEGQMQAGILGTLAKYESQHRSDRVPPRPETERREGPVPRRPTPLRLAVRHRRP